MKRILILLVATMSLGCQSTKPAARVFSRTYKGEGLYLYAHSLTATNGPDDFAVELTVCNGFAAPVFVNAEEAVIFQGDNVRVVCYDHNGNVLARGETGLCMSSPRSHPEDYVRIRGGRVPNEELVFTCCEGTGFTYRHPLDFRYFFPEDESSTTEIQDILTRTHKMDVTVPVHIEYFLEGNGRRFACDTNVTVTVTRQKTDSQRQVGGAEKPGPQP